MLAKAYIVKTNACECLLACESSQSLMLGILTNIHLFSKYMCPIMCQDMCKYFNNSIITCHMLAHIFEDLISMCNDMCAIICVRDILRSISFAHVNAHKGSHFKEFTGFGAYFLNRLFSKNYENRAS